MSLSPARGRGEVRGRADAATLFAEPLPASAVEEDQCREECMNIDRLRRFIADMTSLVGGAWQDKDEAAIVEVGAEAAEASCVGHDDWLPEAMAEVPAARLCAEPAVVRSVRALLRRELRLGAAARARRCTIIRCGAWSACCAARRPRSASRTIPRSGTLARAGSRRRWRRATSSCCCRQKATSIR